MPGHETVTNSRSAHVSHAQHLNKFHEAIQQQYGAARAPAQRPSAEKPLPPTRCHAHTTWQSRIGAGSFVSASLKRPRSGTVDTHVRPQKKALLVWRPHAALLRRGAAGLDQSGSGDTPRTGFQVARTSSSPPRSGHTDSVNALSVSEDYAENVISHA